MRLLGFHFVGPMKLGQTCERLSQGTNCGAPPGGVAGSAFAEMTLAACNPISRKQRLEA